MDRRKYPRRHLIFYLRIFNESDDLIGYLLDIAENGILMISEQNMDEGIEKEIKIKLPKEIESGDYIQFRGIIRWVQKSSNDNYYDIGIEMKTHNEKNYEIIKNLVDYCGFLK